MTRSTVSLSLSISLVSAALGTIASGCATTATTTQRPVAYAYERYDRTAFPARVRAIKYSGQTFDSSSPMQRGAWKVSFRLDGAVAEQPPEVDGAFYVKGLECTNETKGTKDCWLEVRASRGARLGSRGDVAPGCYVLIQDDSGEKMNVLDEA